MRILVVEDEPALARTVMSALVAEGLACDAAASLADAALLADLHAYAVVILDRRLPDGDGAELCRRWRSEGRSFGVLMLTALDGTAATVQGFDSGADDYLTKPFAGPELTARVHALLRRAPVAPRPVVKVGDLEIDRGRRRVRRDGVVISLPRRSSLSWNAWRWRTVGSSTGSSCSSSAGTMRRTPDPTSSTCTSLRYGANWAPTRC